MAFAGPGEETVAEPRVFPGDSRPYTCCTVWGPSAGRPWPASPEWVAWGRLAHPVAVYTGEPPGVWTRVH